MSLPASAGVVGKRLFREAREWLTSREEIEIFSCVTICYAVVIDPDFLRKGLLAWPPEKRGQET
jgi:hypothetical protein